MLNSHKLMYRRINVTLPKETIELLNQIVPKGARSRFIDEAVKYYIAETNTGDL